MHAVDSHPVTFIDLMRHGLPVGGTRYRGQLDDPLSEQGWQEMWSTVGDHAPWSRIVSSPLKRCRDFAEQLAQRHALPLQIEQDFREVSFGDWEGMAVAEVMETQAQAVRRYWQDPLTCTPPNGEPLSEFCARVACAWDALATSAEAEHVLLVAHGGVIRAVLAHVLQMPIANVLRLEVPSAAISRIRIQPDINGRPHPSLVFHAGAL